MAYYVASLPNILLSCQWLFFLAALPPGSFPPRSLKARSGLLSTLSRLYFQPMPTRSDYLPHGNASLYYELAGAGQPLVMIHAGVADSRQWDNEFAYFAQDHCVLRYDLRGYGRSLPVDGDYSHLTDLKALLDHLALDQPLILMGCSMGGGLAMDFALTYPARVKALVMVGSAPSDLQLDAPDHPQYAAAEEAYKAGDWALLAELETQIWFDGLGRTPQQVNQSMRRLALEMNTLALSHAAQRLGKRLPDADPPAAGRLGELHLPLLVIVGEHDLPYLQAAADYMLEHIPSATKIVIPDAAHLPNMDQPALFQASLQSFLDSLT